MNVPRHLLVHLLLAFALLLGCKSNVATFDSPEQVAVLLSQGSAEEQSRLKDVLHMPFQCDPSARPCSAQAEPALLEQGRETAIIQVKQSYDFVLLVLARNQNGRWQYLDSIPLNAAYDRLTVDLQSIVSHPVQEIVVHQHVIVRGTGIYQANFVILKMDGGRLTTVLDTVEESHLDSDLTQSSTFEVIPKSEEQNAEVKETQALTVGKRTTTMERKFTWENELRLFQVSFWHTYKVPGESQ